MLSHDARLLLKDIGLFGWQTLKAFRANQGLLLAGAVAYYALLSIIPLLILIVIALSHIVDEARLLATLHLYLEWIIPGQAMPIVTELANFLAHRDVLGWILFGTMLFFSSLAFTVLENAFSVIFVHRVVIHRRHFLVSAILPYCYILCLGIGFLVVTLVSGLLQTIGERNLLLFGYVVPLGSTSGALLYLLGVTGEVFVLTSVYIVMPVGRLTLRRALLGGVPAALLWELTRHVLVWYFASLSQVSTVYGSLTTSVVVLLSFEIGATLLLFGAQVIAEYERYRKNETDQR